MRRYAPTVREFWRGYFDPESQQDVPGVMTRAREAVEMRTLLEAVDETYQPLTPMEIVKETADIIGIKSADGHHLKSQIEGLRGSHFTPEEAELLYVGLAASAVLDEMEITADGI